MQSSISETQQIWRCIVCGYLHEGAKPPEECPVCGAKANEFEIMEQPAVTAKPESKPKAWRCLVCDYIHEGTEPPAECPVCGASANEFEPVEEPEETPAAAGAASEQAVPEKFVIIGGGIAGLTAAEAFREKVTEGEITIVNEEPGLPYYRLNLTRYLAGEIKPTSLPIRPQQWFEESNIKLIDGTSATDLDPEAGKIQLSNGNELSYDRLLLCPGSHPYTPPIPNSQLPKIKTLRTKEDADEILEQIASGAKCTVVGGGVLGIETAGALARRGGDVTLLESHEWLMPRQLNRSAAERVKKHLQSLGVKLKENARTSRFNGSADNGLESIELQSGEEIPADLAILATGVRPNTALARKAGLEVDTGIVVDNHLRTSRPSIFAAGDAAEHNGTLYGLWNPSQFQGKIAGINAGGGSLEFGGMPRNNTLKLAGIDVCSIGEIHAHDGSYLTMEEDRENMFCRLIFHDDYLAGAILMGDGVEYNSAIRKAIENRQHFGPLLQHQPTIDKILKSLELQ